MKKQITTIACVCAFTAGTAMAGEQASKFKKLDTNQDGYISATEASANETLRKQWKAIDQDGNNRIDQSEFSALELESTGDDSEE